MDKTFLRHIISFLATTGEVIHLTLVQRDEPLVLLLRGPSDQLVASTPINDVNSSTNNYLDYPISANGSYVVEVTGLGAQYDLYMTCDGQGSIPAPNMLVLYNGDTIPSGSTIAFPVTGQGAPTNVLLVVTNAGNANLGISGFVMDGDFVMTNSAWSHLTLAGGGSTNFGLKFNATSNGLAFGALTLSTTNTFPANYVVYIEAFTYPTSAPPTVQWTLPLNNSTIFDNEDVLFQATATPGSAGMDSGEVGLYMVETNGQNFTGYNLDFNAPDDYEMLRSISDVTHADGDFAFTATVKDLNGQSATAPPVLVHVIPYSSANPSLKPQLEVLLNGTNIPSGNTVVFPQTTPGQATGMFLVITNTGSYPRWDTGCTDQWRFHFDE